MPIANTLGLTLNNIEEIRNLEDVVKDIIKDCEQPECQHYSFALWSASRSANDDAQKKILELLYYICSFTIENDGMNRGLKTYLNFNAKTNELPDIIDDLDIDIFNKLASKINNVDILARIYDSIWCSQKKDYKSAVKALENYYLSIKLLVNIEYWPASIERIERAVILGKTINNHNIINEIINFSVRQAEINPVQSNTFYAIKLIEFLSKQKELDPYYDKMIYTCSLKAQSFRKKQDYYKASDYYESLARICHNHSDFELEKRYLELFAETEIEQGEQCICEQEKSFFKVVYHYKRATEVLKKTGKKQRYNETHKKLLEYQQQALSEMKMSSYQFNVSDVVENTMKLFEPLNFSDSLIAFAQVFTSPTEEQINKYIEQQKKLVFKSLFPIAQLDSKGRIIAFANTNQLGEMSDKERKQTAFEHLQNHWNIFSICYVSVFLRHMSTVTFTKADLQKFLNNNPLIETGRENFFINGLYSGFQYEFATSLHLLVPQIENMFRYILNNNGILTTKIENGLQEDMDINQLLTFDEQREELNRVFGKEIMLDFEGLLIGRIGANIRNKLAHGLLTYDECFSAPAIYLWALLLKVIILGWLIINRSEKQETSNEHTKINS